MSCKFNAVMSFFREIDTESVHPLSDLQLLPREKQKHAYLDAVKERYKHLPEISRIDRYYQSFYMSLCCSGESLLKLF